MKTASPPVASAPLMPPIKQAADVSPPNGRLSPIRMVLFSPAGLETAEPILILKLPVTSTAESPWRCFPASYVVVESFETVGFVQTPVVLLLSASLPVALFESPAVL
jgi:hypothetical protein